MLAVEKKRKEVLDMLMFMIAKSWIYSALVLLPLLIQLRSSCYQTEWKR